MEQENQKDSKTKFGISAKRLIKFLLAIILYTLFVIWVGSLWLLIGYPILFDVYITKRVKWIFWKKNGKPINSFVEWIDALVFAVIAVTIVNIFVFQNYKIPSGSMEKTLLIGDHLYVSKLRFGPKMPNTPISFPFAQHTLPLTLDKPSFVDWVQWPYKRLKGFATIKNDDNVVFNFPEGDTVVLAMQAESYYSIVRRFADAMKEEVGAYTASQISNEKWLEQSREYVRSHYDVVYRPVDKRDNYIKRCVAIPGDVLEVKHGQVYINNRQQDSHLGIQYDHIITTDGRSISDKVFENLGIYHDDVYRANYDEYQVPLTQEMAEALKKVDGIVSVEQVENPAGNRAPYIFPHDEGYNWNEDNFGPLTIPAKGVTVDINTANLCLYYRIIHNYEAHDLKVENGKIYIDGNETSQYTFAMDYYFMMGDNRHHSADSRYWGFVPEDHIVGSPVLVWLSLNKDKRFPMNIRWGRFFTKARR